MAGPIPPLPRPGAGPPRRRLGALTRYFVVPMLLLAAGVRMGMFLGPARRPAPAPVPSASNPQPAVQPVQAPSTPSCEIAASFENNIYPSLLLSLSGAYPEYARALTVSVRNLDGPGAYELRLDSDLFSQPVDVGFEAADGGAVVSPALPWNFEALRRNAQMQPHSFVATVLQDGKAVAGTSLVCTVHAVNEAVSRVFNTASGQWQDTSVCFAAFVNEDHPWINTLLQEALAGGAVRAFTGYQTGTQGVFAQVQAVWDALAARGLTYVNVATDSAASPLVSTQYVRFLDQSVRDRGANCVDASVLFASVLRRIGLRPVLLFKPGHCFAGFYDTAEGGRIIAFETTFLGSASFAAASEEGDKELQATLPFVGTGQYSVVDIAVCRQQGVSPIGYEAPDRG